MSRHSFDPEIAAKVGINAAVVFENIKYWCEQNAIRQNNVQDGNAWTYNSVREFAKFFPYLSDKQIRTALDKLETEGLVETSNYNTMKRDRTKWYALNRDSVPFARLVKCHLPSGANPFAREGEPLPDIKPDNKQTPIPPEGAGDLFSAETESVPSDAAVPQNEEAEKIKAGFREFWDNWPTHKRKAGKADCLKAYTNACTGKHAKAELIAPDVLNACAVAYAKSVTDPQFLKAPLGWLRQPGWEPFVEQAQACGGIEITEFKDLSLAQQRALSAGRCPPSMQLEDGKPNATAKFWLNKLRNGGSS